MFTLNYITLKYFTLLLYLRYLNSFPRISESLTTLKYLENLESIHQINRK